MLDLNDLLRDRYATAPTDPDRSGTPGVDPAPKPVLLWANAINHEGHIVACGKMGDDDRIRGYLLIPVDGLQLTLPQYDYFDLGMVSSGDTPPYIGEDIPDQPVSAPGGDVVYGPDDQRVPPTADSILERWDSTRPGESLDDLFESLLHYSAQDHMQQIQAPNNNRYVFEPPALSRGSGSPASAGNDSGDEGLSEREDRSRLPYGGDSSDDPDPPIDCSALGINEHDQVVGAIGQTAVIWESFEAGFLESDRSPSQANAVNDHGEIVGWTADSIQQPAATMWSGGKRRVLFPFAGWISEAKDISNGGEVVGWAENGHAGEAPVAMLWIGLEATDLNTVTYIPLSVEGAVRLEEANAVDDAGRIAGYGRLPNGVVRAFLLTPTE
jgi:hypothetical protein